MQADRIADLLAQLSPEQRQDYERLLQELSQNGGDISQLTPAEQQLLAELSAAMQPTAEASKVVDSEPDVAEQTANVTQPEETQVTRPAPQYSPSATPFGMYVVEQLKVLCEGGSSLADAVRYAFHNKYLPVALRDDMACGQIYQRHRLEIDDLTASLQAVNEAQPKEARVLVGLAWFSILYQCYQYVEAYGDLH